MLFPFVVSVTFGDEYKVYLQLYSPSNVQFAVALFVVSFVELIAQSARALARRVVYLNQVWLSVFFHLD